MSRLFSSSTKIAKALKWKYNGVTEDVDWAVRALERAVDVVPGAAEKVDSAMLK
jgi:hypothetical protein